MRKTVTIDCFPESVSRYLEGYAIVVIDVIRTTTTAVSAAAAGWRCFPVPSLESVPATAGRLHRPILCGELGGVMPAGFDLNNSPVDLLRRKDRYRPVILLSSSGTGLIHQASAADAVYLACFRNYRAVAGYVTGAHSRVALIGAGARGQFREEDQMCCAWIAGLLLAQDYKAGDARTLELVERWRNAPAGVCAFYGSADYLRRSGQIRDLDFILSHVDDLHTACMLEQGEVVIPGEVVRYANCR